MQAVKTKFGRMIKVSMPWRTVLQNVAAAVVSLVVLSWLRIRPLGIFFLALFFFWLYKTRCSFEIKLTSESRRKFKIFKSKIMNTKKNSPTLHFVCFATAFASIAIVGHYMVGIFVPIALVFNILAISLMRHFVEIKKVHSEQKNWKTTDIETNSDGSTTDTNGNNDADIEDDEDEEFVPETNKINLAILEKASEITSPTEDLEDEEHSDDIPSELLIPDSIPEINENSTDEDDELIPVIDVQQKPSTTAEPIAIASKIHFKKGHFKNDPNQSSSLSSSSSEESLSKGLRFPDHTVVDGAALAKADQISDTTPDPASVANVMVTNQLTNMVGSLAIKWLTGAGAGAGSGNGAATTTTSKPKEIELHSDSSQESEFEFLDNE